MHCGGHWVWDGTGAGKTKRWTRSPRGDGPYVVAGRMGGSSRAVTHLPSRIQSPPHLRDLGLPNFKSWQPIQTFRAKQNTSTCWAGQSQMCAPLTAGCFGPSSSAHSFANFGIATVTRVSPGIYLLKNITSQYIWEVPHSSLGRGEYKVAYKFCSKAACVNFPLCLPLNILQNECSAVHHLGDAVLGHPPSSLSHLRHLQIRTSDPWIERKRIHCFW